MLYEKGCKFAVKKFSWIVGDIKKFRKKAEKSVSKEFMESLNFTGLDLEPYEILLFSYAGAIIALIFALFIDFLILFFYNFSFKDMGYITILLMVIITSFFPLITIQLISEYPKTKAKYMKIHSLGDVPEVLSYIVMYLKLIPNLENALRFAAKESKTSLGKDLKKLIWDLEVRIHQSIDDALTFFANLWGKWSDYLKRALHLIRSSIHEKDESQRITTLDRSLDVVLDGTKSVMKEFANKLHQPTLIIYSIGVMIPLALVAMLPTASIIGFRITIFQIFLLYDIILPLLLFFYIRKILLSRPATFNPPVVPKKHPSIEKVDKKKNFIIALIICIFISLLAWIFPATSYFPPTFFPLWGVCAGISFYCLKTYTAYKKIRDEIKEMEKEFGDSLYILGKRIMEGRPAEEAFSYASQTMEGSKIGEVYRQTAFNLLSMRIDINDALFDKKFGSLRHVYSERIRAIMRLFVEGVKKSYTAAGVAIVKIADHLKQLQDVERGIKNDLGILTSTLRSTAIIFAPVIAGVTLGITNLISKIFNKMNLKEIITKESIFSFFGTPKFAIENINPGFFVFVIGIYIIQLVILLTRFANGIDEGDDRIQYMYTLGKALPNAIIIFTIVTILSMIIFQEMA